MEERLATAKRYQSFVGKLLILDSTWLCERFSPKAKRPTGIVGRFIKKPGENLSHQRLWRQLAGGVLSHGKLRLPTGREGIPTPNKNPAQQSLDGVFI